MRVHAVPATITVAPDAQLADDRVNSDRVLFQRRSAGGWQLARLQTAADEANKTVSRAESIRRFRVLPVDLTEQDGYLTPTMKVKRALIHKDFAAEIEELYR